MCVKINEPYIHTDDLFLKVCVASIRPHRVPNHVYYLTPLIQYHGLDWPVDVWSADNIELMEINILSHYSLIHDLAQNETSFLPHFYNKNPSYGLPNQTKQKSRKRQSLFFL